MGSEPTRFSGVSATVRRWDSLEARSQVWERYPAVEIRRVFTRGHPKTSLPIPHNAQQAAAL